MHVKNAGGKELVWTIDLKKVRFNFAIVLESSATWASNLNELVTASKEAIRSAVSGRNHASRSDSGKGWH